MTLEGEQRIAFRWYVIMIIKISDRLLILRLLKFVKWTRPRLNLNQFIVHFRDIGMKMFSKGTISKEPTAPHGLKHSCLSLLTNIVKQECLDNENIMLLLKIFVLKPHVN